MDWRVVIIMGVILGLGLIIRMSRERYSPSGGYQIRDRFLTKAERSFYGALRQSLGDEFAVMAKVRVADVISPRKGLSRSQWQTDFYRIAMKNFEFVMCERGSMTVHCMVELNDRSHERKSR